MLPLILSEGVNKQRITLFDVHRVLCENPARIFGLYGKKGGIGPGFDADLVIIDLKLEKTVSVEKLHCKIKQSPYEGSRFKGWPVTTILRGNIVFNNETIINKSGSGQFIPMKIE
jgi:dihydroorotase-like cyclic amidohydrolase